jgi:hypothetical protein
MSLHKFAEQVASQGRGDDSLLVHMTPDEVRNLQQFAQANGTTLTINPVTGLPEAGLLSDLFKSIAPIALGAFLGPAGFGMSSMMAGLTTGGITALATGSLSRGLMAGLGAYGGAGLGDSLMTAGGGMSAANAATTAQQQLSGANLALGEAMPAQAAEQFTKDAVSRMTPSGALSAGFNKAIASPTAAMDFAKGNLGNLAYAAAPIMAGAMVPTTTKMPDPKDRYIRMMDYNINPDTGKPDPLYGMREMTPIKTSDFKGTTFQGQRDLFRQQNPNPYELGVGSLNQPPQQQQQTTPMASGGIVALSKGGDAALAAYQAGDYATANRLLGEAGMSAQDVVSKYNLDTAQAADVARNLGYAGDMGGIQYGSGYVEPVAETVAYTPPVADRTVVNRAAIEPDYFEQQFAPDVFTPVTTPTQPPAGIETLTAAAPTVTTSTQQPTGIETLTAPVTPTATAASTTPTYNKYTNEEIAKYLIDNPTVDIAKAIKETNADPVAVNAYIASLATPFVGSTDTTGGSGTLGIYNQMKAQGIDPTELYSAATAANPQYAGYTQPMIEKAYNLDKGAYALSDQLKGNVSDKEWVKFMDDNKYSIDDAAQAFGLSRNEVKSRYDAVKAAEKKVVPPVVLPPPSSVVPGGTQLPGATVYDNGAFGNYGSGPATGVDYRGNTVSIATPGDIITNPDQTRTVVPNIPGRPYGGFTGSEQVKSRYTAGGGSLGYTAPIPKDPQTAFNKLTDDSLDAYNFLMGKGKNLSQRKPAADRPVMQRYDEAVLGRKIGRPTRTTPDKVKTVTGTPGQPQTYFNEAEYLAANPDVAAELKTGKSASGQPVRYTSGYEHYLMYGKSGGRPFTGDYEGYLTAAALANAAGAGGGGDAGPSGPSGTPGTPGSGNAANSITGLAQDANMSIADTGIGPSAPAPGTPAGDGDSAGDDAVGGYYSRGKLNYRAKNMAMGGATGYAIGGGLGSLGSYSDGGRLLKGPGDGVSDSIPATIGRKQQPARLADGEFVIPARIVSELGNGSTDAGAKKLYAMMDRVQKARGKTTGKNKVAANSRSDKYLPA